MTIPDWHEEPISKKRDLKAFDCGKDGDALNEFLRRFAYGNHKKGGAKTFLAIEDSSGRIRGYYSLAPASADYEQTPESARKGLPGHPVPDFRLARLATEKSLQGGGLGTQLLLAAGKRCIQVAGEIGGEALFIDAKTERAAKWYEDRGAERLIGISEGFPVPMVTPLKTLEVALKEAGKL